jgi:ADP-heptose:LPS heptosyltransferase
LKVPSRILVLRNNDLGDVIVVTPLFEALRRLYPQARLVAGVGRWAAPIFAGNPYVDAVAQVDAPWFNKYLRGGFFQRLRFLFGPTVRDLRKAQFDLGIDVLGSRWGELLLLRSGIPARLGRTGFAGGGRWATATIPHRLDEGVGANALRFAKLLGATEVPKSRPQIFLSPEERETGEAFWGERPGGARRILLAPGSGLPEKSWPVDSFVRATAMFAEDARNEVGVLCGLAQVEVGRALSQAGQSVRMVPAGTSLRHSFAAIAGADAVLCNSSFVLHVAAAFGKPALAVLGPSFDSARGHQLVWGHEGTASIGRETGERTTLASAAEAVASLTAMLEARR